MIKHFHKHFPGNLIPIQKPVTAMLLAAFILSGCSKFSNIGSSKTKTSAASITIKADETAFKRITSCAGNMGAAGVGASSYGAGGYSYGFNDPTQSCVTRELQEEIKNNLLLSVDLLKPRLQETMSVSADLYLKEVLIFRTQSTALRICGMADGKFKTVKKSKEAAPGAPSADPALAASASYYQPNNSYGTGATASPGTATADPCQMPLVSAPTASGMPTGAFGAGGYGATGGYGTPYTTGTMGNTSASGPLGAQVAGVFDLLTTDYRVSFVFADRQGPKGAEAGTLNVPNVSSSSVNDSFSNYSSTLSTNGAGTPANNDPNSPQGNVYRYSLSKGLTVEELIDIQLKSSLNADLIDTLPEFLGKILANFFQEISVSLNGGGRWSRRSTVPSKMYLRSKGSPVTPMVLELAQEVIIPLCRDAVRTRKGDPNICEAKLPSDPDPRVDIRALERAKAASNLQEKRSSVYGVQNCIKTGLQSGGKSVYKLFFAASPDISLPEGTPLSKYMRVNGGWQLKKLGFGDQILKGSIGDKKSCKTITPKQVCHYVQYYGDPGAWGSGFDGVCENLKKSKPGTVNSWGISRFQDEVIAL